MVVFFSQVPAVSPWVVLEAEQKALVSELVSAWVALVEVRNWREAALSAREASRVPQSIPVLKQRKEAELQVARDVSVQRSLVRPSKTSWAMAIETRFGTQDTAPVCLRDYWGGGGVHHSSGIES
jgi:hypothetical protein